MIIFRKEPYQYASKEERVRLLFSKGARLVDPEITFQSDRQNDTNFPPNKRNTQF